MIWNFCFTAALLMSVHSIRTGSVSLNRAALHLSIAESRRLELLLWQSQQLLILHGTRRAISIPDLPSMEKRLPRNSIQSPSPITKLSSHLRRALAEQLRLRERSAKTSEERASLYVLLGVIAHCREERHSAEQWLQRALTLHPESAHIKNILGTVLTVQGKYSQAERLFKRSLALNRKGHTAKKHVNLALTLTNLASLAFLQKRYPTARSYYQQSLHLRRTSPLQNRDIVGIAENLNGIAESYRGQNDYVQANLYARRAMDTLMETYPNGHAQVVQSLFLQGEIALLQEQKKSSKLYLEAIRMTRRCLPPGSLDRASLLRIASFVIEDDDVLVEKSLHEALEIRRSVLTEGAPSIGLILHDFAFYYMKRGNYPLASSYFKQVISLLENLGTEEILLVLEQYEEMLESIGQRAEAQRVHKKYTKSRERFSASGLLK